MTAKAEVTPLPDGGIEARVRIPTDSGEASFAIQVERDDDAWRVFIPWPDELSDQIETLSGGYEVSNGIVYLAAPEDTVCAKCGSPLTPPGYCTDETCPYSDHLQTESWTEG